MNDLGFGVTPGTSCYLDVEEIQKKLQEASETPEHPVLFQKLDTIICKQNNSQEDIDYLLGLSIEWFELYISYRASELLKWHIDWKWHIDHAFSELDETIVWSAISAWIIEEGVDLDQIRYDSWDNQEKMKQRYAVSMVSLKWLVVQAKHQHRKGFQSAIKTMQSRTRDTCCSICDDH